MTKYTDPFSRSSRRSQRQLLLVQSMSGLGVFSLLSSNLALAQASSVLDAALSPSVDNSQPATVSVSIEKSAPIAPRLAPAPIRKPQPVPVRQVTPLQVYTTPAPAPVAKVRALLQVQTQSPRLVKTPINSSKDYSNAYIDPTPYKVGADSVYTAPNRVVISERSTGCRAVLQGGQGLPGSLCGRAPVQRVTVATRGIQSVNNFRVSRSQTPRLAMSNPALPVARMAPVRLGPLTVSVNGLSATQRPPSLPSQIALRTMPWPVQSSANNYSPTIQPITLPSSVNTGMTFPLTIPAMITSLFGWRISPITGNQQFHSGTDLGAPLGTPVLAAYGGSVAIANLLGGYGLAVVLDHKQLNEQTLYGHLSEIFVQPGEWVEQGTVIGRVGSTGNSTGPHLHFEVRQQTPEGWVATDPGVQLEYALAQLVEALHTAQAPQPQSSGQGG